MGAIFLVIIFCVIDNPDWFQKYFNKTVLTFKFWSFAFKFWSILVLLAYKQGVLY